MNHFGPYPKDSGNNKVEEGAIFTTLKAGQPYQLRSKNKLLDYFRCYSLGSMSQEPSSYTVHSSSLSPSTSEMLSRGIIVLYINICTIFKSWKKNTEYCLDMWHWPPAEDRKNNLFTGPLGRAAHIEGEAAGQHTMVKTRYDYSSHPTFWQKC